jgi:ElaB/YqjD/DUF883 family membrane-anchored ribosome-binding protein
MDKEIQKLSNDIGTLAEDTRTLMAATADVAGENVHQARKRLAAALDNGKEFIGRVREKAVESTKAADQVLRENPYQAVAIAVGIGAAIGFLLGRRTRD